MHYDKFLTKTKRWMLVAFGIMFVFGIFATSQPVKAATDEAIALSLATLCDLLVQTPGRPIRAKGVLRQAHEDDRYVVCLSGQQVLNTHQ